MKHFLPTLFAALALALLLNACEKNDTPIIPGGGSGTGSEPEPEDTAIIIEAGADGSLGGTLIGTRYSVDYSTNERSETVNTKENVFDRNFNTYFASNMRS